jgi:hypothetical protein|tara:strand:+ start:10817 stop:11365 length:549 start_codon:yes stop_codon:yes gene_type:complete
MLKNIQADLQKFGRYVVQQSRSNLTKQKRNVSKNLYNSLKYDLESKNDDFTLSFIMDEYGTFLDKGVKGTKSNYIENAKSPYSYRNKKPPMQPLADWAKKRNIRLRQYKIVDGKRVSTGKFAKGNYRTIGFILQKSIFEKGIKASMFFTKPFEVAFERYKENISKTFIEDIIDLIKTKQWEK